MRSPKPFSLLLAVSIAFLTTTPAVSQAPTRPHAEVVTLDFDWPVGMRADVDLVKMRIAGSEQMADSSRIRVTYEMAVEDHPEGRLIHYSGFSVPGLAAPVGLEQRMLQVASSVVPSYVVSEEGLLLHVHELAELRADIVGWMRDEVGGEDMGGFEAILDQLLTEETLHMLAAEEWGMLVSAWAGAEFEIGAAYELYAEEPVPLLGNAMVPFHYELGASGRVSCRDGGSDRDCVELILRSRPDPDEFGPRLDAFLREMLESAVDGGELPPISYDDFEVRNEIVLIAEPDGLIPHMLTSTRIAEMVIDVGGMRQVGGGQQVAHYVFTIR